MKRTTCGATSVALVLLALSGCTGGDNQPIQSNAPVAGAAEDQRTPVSDALTPGEAAQVNQAESEPAPPEKSDS